MMREDWVEVELGDLAKFIDYRGRTPKKTASGIPLITAKNVRMGYIKEEPKEYIDESDYENWMTRGIPEKGDVLFTTEAPMGYVAQLKTDNKIALAQRLITFQPVKEIENTFLKSSLMSPYFQTILDSLGTGTTVKGIKAAKLKLIKIRIAPLPEQRAIVAKIEALFSDLDKGIADLKKAQAQLKIYRQAVLKKAFEGNLTSTKMGIRTLGSLTTIITKGASPKWQGFDYTADESELLFITSENVREGYVSLKKEKYLPVGFNEIQKRSVLQKGDVLFNIVGASIGRAAIFELDKLSNINQAVALIRLNKEILNQYVNYFLNSEGAKQEYLKKQVEVARANLSLQNVKDIEIPFCNEADQRRVIREIESRLSVCDKVEQTITESLEKAKALRQSILKKAFEGSLLSDAEIEQCKQAPDYEPASVLLAKIKAEKNKK